MAGLYKMDDNNFSARLSGVDLNLKTNPELYSDNFKGIMHSYNLFGRNEIDLINKTYRFGVFNPYGALTKTKEFLFFTKPDLNILYTDDSNGVVSTNRLNPALSSRPYWKELFESRSRIIPALQQSAYRADKFNHLLQNQVISNLEVPGLSAETIETPTNMYGVGFSYRGSSESSDDTFDFTLEFKDTKWLDLYYYFKTYEEYETLKHHGTVSPYKKYIERKELHDQFSIYKFLVDEDMETIIYYSKFYGVIPKSLPRDVFGNGTFDNGISYSIDFRAAFFEELQPEIIADFNDLSKAFYNAQPYRVDIYNDVLGRADNRAAKAAYIVKEESNYSPNRFVYKLKWRGSDIV